MTNTCSVFSTKATHVAYAMSNLTKNVSPRVRILRFAKRSISRLHQRRSRRQIAVLLLFHHNRLFLISHQWRALNVSHPIEVTRVRLEAVVVRWRVVPRLFTSTMVDRLHRSSTILRSCLVKANSYRSQTTMMTTGGEAILWWGLFPSFKNDIYKDFFFNLIKLFFSFLNFLNFNIIFN